MLRLRRLLLTATLLTMIAGLIALGVWQLDRRIWKLDLIARVDARLAAAAVPAPGPGDWPALSREREEYLRVTASGRFLNDRETAVQAVTELGAGYWILTPLETPEFTVLINRGFVPPDRRDPATRPEAEFADKVSIDGLLRLSEPGGGFLRSNDPAAGRWYSRDVDAIARADDLTGVAPYFIDADAAPNPGGVPVGGLTVVHFRNSHLSYALTWFALAAGLAIACVIAFRARVFSEADLKGSAASKKTHLANPKADPVATAQSPPRSIFPVGIAMQSSKDGIRIGNRDGLCALPPECRSKT